jgi:hypothetical protein
MNKRAITVVLGIWVVSVLSLVAVTCSTPTQTAGGGTETQNGIIVVAAGYSMWGSAWPGANIYLYHAEMHGLPEELVVEPRTRADDDGVFEIGGG